MFFAFSEESKKAHNNDIREKYLNLRRKIVQNESALNKKQIHIFIRYLLWTNIAGVIKKANKIHFFNKILKDALL